MSDKETLLQDIAPCSLQELCERGLLQEEFVVACIDSDVVPVTGPRTSEWHFSSTSVIRLHKAWRLHRDLGLQVDNLALVLDLLDERDALAREINALRYRLNRWEE